MPPRGAPRGEGARGGPPGRGGPPRGGGPPGGRGGGPAAVPPSFRGRGGPPARGGAPAGRGGGSAGAGTALVPGIVPGYDIETIGVRRPGRGTAGRALKVFTNHYSTTIPEEMIYHYDVIGSGDNKFPVGLNIDIIKSLQQTVAPAVFTPRAVYDGRKNMFAPRRLPFSGGGDTAEFDVVIDNPDRPVDATRPPKSHKVKLKLVADINPEVLARFLQGKQSHDNTVLTAITALNVVVRMQPTMLYPFNIRSFFTDRETKSLGGGMVLWRGYFQSVRPAPGKMVINVDISTGLMFKPGPLIGVALEVLNRPPNDMRALGPRNQKNPGTLDDRDRLRLQRFLAGVRVLTLDRTGKPTGTPRPVKKLSALGASQVSFNLREGGTQTVADFFQTARNQPLRFPHLICAEVGQGALIPFELCVVPPGQIMRRQVPPEMTKSVLDFATKRPEERLRSILDGRDILAYGQSEYVRQFGMNVDTSGPMKIDARVLEPPTLKYGQGSKMPTIRPRDGAWNMIDKRFYKPCTIDQWAVCIYETRQRFNEQAAQQLVTDFLACCQTVGVPVVSKTPPIFHLNAHLSVQAELAKVGGAVKQASGKLPSLLVIVLPEGAQDLYVAIKHFGDIRTGVATQCLKSSKCFRAKMQYFANVLLKVNVKLGGINTVPEARSAAILTDPANPTIVMGADVIHPAPGSQGRPSFTSLVGNVDGDVAKYVAASRVQTSKQEMIDDLEDMAKNILQSYLGYRKQADKVANPAPKRIIFYRDGVSEGQFKQVLELELPRLKAACAALKINPKITVVVVGKRHHVRFFPENQSQADRSGNCIAGTVVDTDVAHPVEFDFYLQSHGGLLGTSRPSHYSVLYDENNFGPDALQQLSFALCHVYARATRSVSIPAPVYYADIVCSRAKHHFDPEQTGDLDVDFSHSAGDLGSAAGSEGPTLDRYKQLFKPLHASAARMMYFS